MLRICQSCEEEYETCLSRNLKYCSRECHLRVWERNKGTKLNDKQKKKLSEIAKTNGFGKWMIGKKHSEETKQKMRESSYWKGKKRPLFTEEHREKIGEAGKGRKQSIESRKKKSDALKGDKGGGWRGGITPINAKIRNSLEYKLWREEIFERDDWTCQECKKRGGKLNADHIKPFALFPKLRFELTNGRTLCTDCHKVTDTYGWKSLCVKK